MRDFWRLPPEFAFGYSGSEWLLNLLQSLDTDMCAKVMFLLWRVWHHRNNIVHGDGKASVSASVPYLVNYLETFSTVSDPKVDVKGKSVLPLGNDLDPAGPDAISAWVAPRIGEVKANVDAGWDALSRTAGIGVIIRDHNGHVIMLEWMPIKGCTSAEEAEIHAALAGLKRLINLRRWPTTLESDCSQVVQTITTSTIERSGFWCLYEETRELLKIFTQITVSKIDRVSNYASHSLAHLGKSGDSGILFGATPICASDAVAQDCNL
jgi:ribonuclease HI